jgi:uncharacterized protein with HEPN domain
MSLSLTGRAGLVLGAINDFEFCLSGRTPEVLAREDFWRLAIERSFKIICGTLRRLPDSVKAQQPEIDWQGMSDLEYRLHHFYHCNNASALREIAARNLPPLRASFANRKINGRDKPGHYPGMTQP